MCTFTGRIGKCAASHRHMYTHSLRLQTREDVHNKNDNHITLLESKIKDKSHVMVYNCKPIKCLRCLTKHFRQLLWGIQLKCLFLTQYLIFIKYQINLLYGNSSSCQLMMYLILKNLYVKLLPCSIQFKVVVVHVKPSYLYLLMLTFPTYRMSECTHLLVKEDITVKFVC